MARKLKRPKYQGRVRAIVSENLRHLLPRRFPDEPDRVKALARAAGVSRSSVQRAFNAQHGASIDIVEAMAMALGVHPHELLMVNRRRQ